MIQNTVQQQQLRKKQHLRVCPQLCKFFKSHIRALSRIFWLGGKQIPHENSLGWPHPFFLILFIYLFIYKYTIKTDQTFIPPPQKKQHKTYNQMDNHRHCKRPGLFHHSVHSYTLEVKYHQHTTLHEMHYRLNHLVNVHIHWMLTVTHSLNRFLYLNYRNEVNKRRGK